MTETATRPTCGRCLRPMATCYCAHLQVLPGTDTHAVLDQARALLAVRHKLEHATLQVEPVDHTGCEQVGW